MTPTQTIFFYIIMGVMISCVLMGFYLKSLPKPKTDWHEQFIIFLNERDMFWFYQSGIPIPNDCIPNEYVMRMTGYNKGSRRWVILNAQWQERVKEIEEENK